MEDSQIEKPETPETNITSEEIISIRYSVEHKGKGYSVEVVAGGLWVIEDNEEGEEVYDEDLYDEIRTAVEKILDERESKECESEKQ